MRRIIAGALALTLGLAHPAMAGEDHLVSASRIESELVATARARTLDLARIDALLARPELGRAAARVGLDVRRVRAVVPHLDDADLHELAVRSQTLRTDPVAGSPIYPEFPMAWVVVFLLLVLALLVGAVLGIKALVD